MTRQIGYATAGLLRAISRGYRYGLDIMEATGLPSGTVYPTLTRLESRGFVAGQWESQATADREKRPRRRYYKLTAAGKAALAESTRLYGALVEDGAFPLKPSAKER
jgi:PadR family transcriptional regulator PadR